MHMLHWYEGCRQLWIQRGPKWDEGLLNLSEDFFDALMVSYKTDFLVQIQMFFSYHLHDLNVPLCYRWFTTRARKVDFYFCHFMLHPDFKLI